MFYDASQFEFSRALRAHWREILREYRGVASELQNWVESELFEGSWSVLELYSFPHGEPIEANCRRCPIAAELVGKYFPRHAAAGFSRLAPGCVIHPHEGYQGETLRCHLALEVPKGDCRLSLGGETRAWQRGELLIFDDRVTHSAWNRSDADRVVLLVDFVPPA